jgi:hypothetical protein
LFFSVRSCVCLLACFFVCLHNFHPRLTYALNGCSIHKFLNDAASTTSCVCPSLRQILRKAMKLFHLLQTQINSLCYSMLMIYGCYLTTLFGLRRWKTSSEMELWGSGFWRRQQRPLWR